MFHNRVILLNHPHWWSTLFLWIECSSCWADWKAFERIRKQMILLRLRLKQGGHIQEEKGLPLFRIRYYLRTFTIQIPHTPWLRLSLPLFLSFKGEGRWAGITPNCLILIPTSFQRNSAFQDDNSHGGLTSCEEKEKLRIWIRWVLWGSGIL